MKKNNSALKILFSSILLISLLATAGASGTIFISGFEAPILDEWSGTYVKGGAGTISRTQNVFHHGTTSLESKVTATNGYACVFKDVSERSSANARAYFKLNRLPSDGKKYSLIGFEKLEWGCATAVCLMNDAGTLKWVVYYYDKVSVCTYSESYIPAVDAWFCLEIKHGIGIELYVDGTQLVDVTGMEKNVDRVSFGIGYTNGTVHAVYDIDLILYTDCAVISSSYIGPQPSIESCDSFGTTKHTYAFPEAVYITGNGYDCSTTIPLYVVSNVQTWTDGMTIPPRVPNTETTVSSDSSGNIAATTAWSESLPGEYDVVVDVNGNGKYDECIDALDDKDIDVTTAGFFVISEYKFGTILALTACFFSLGIYTQKISKRKRVNPS